MDMRSCFIGSTWNPAVNMQQPPHGTSHLILGDSLVRVLQNMRPSWITTVLAFSGATVAAIGGRVDDPGQIVGKMILIGTDKVSRSPDKNRVNALHS